MFACAIGLLPLLLDYKQAASPVERKNLLKLLSMIAQFEKSLGWP